MDIIKSDRFNEKMISLETYECVEKRTIRLTGEINPERMDDIIQKLEYLNSISPDEEITVFINSPGGSVTAGFALIDAIGRLSSDVIFIAQGMAASMAAVILASGKKGQRKASENAEIILHQPWGGISGQASDIELAATQFKKNKNKINVLLSKVTGQSLSKITKDTDRDFYLSAKEALEYGLIDEVV